MDETKTYTELEAERLFAVKYFNKIWDLLEKPERSKEEDQLMLEYAYTSLTHWRVVGTPLNLQRGIWMLSRVHSYLDQAVPALALAEQCLSLTNQHKELMEDFDTAFAYEAMARAHAVSGNKEETKEYLLLAKEAGDLLKDKDKEIFYDELNHGDWHGLK